MTAENSRVTPNSCHHYVGGNCSCSEHIARFGALGGWGHRINKIGTVTVLRRMQGSGLLSELDLLADMRRRSFPAEEIETLAALISEVRDVA